MGQLFSSLIQYLFPNKEYKIVMVMAAFLLQMKRYISVHSVDIWVRGKICLFKDVASRRSGWTMLERRQLSTGCTWERPSSRNPQWEAM